jgi:hypothetical protein
MPIFRKKPVEIEARYLDGNSYRKIMEWVGPDADYYHATTGTMYIKTREGVMTAGRGDWIIKGVKGEFYPCKPDIFDATYEPVSKDAKDEEKATDARNRS